MTTFTLDPYVGALPIDFNMTASDVGRVLGPPRKVLPSALGGYDELRQDINIGYTTEGSIAGIVLLPNSSLLFEGQDLFRAPDTVGFLSQFDSPMTAVGMIMFLELGVRLSGFHDSNEADKAIEVVRRGHWDEFKSRLVPYKME
jgi:hypothetical protein